MLADFFPSSWSSMLLKPSEEFFSYILLVQNLFLFVFSWLFVTLSLSLLVLSFCSCIIFWILFSHLSVFSSRSLSFLETIILIYFSGNLYISIYLGSILGRLFCFFYHVIFSLFFMFLERLHSCLSIWRNSRSSQSLRTGFGRVRSFPISLSGDAESLSNIFYELAFSNRSSQFGLTRVKWNCSSYSFSWFCAYLVHCILLT